MRDKDIKEIKKVKLAKAKWREVYKEVEVAEDNPYEVCITIEANFCLKTNFTEEEDHKLSQALNEVENIIRELRRRRK